MTASASNIVRWRHLIPTPGANVQVTRRSDGTNEVRKRPVWARSSGG
jgi:hypothetical protein